MPRKPKQEKQTITVIVKRKPVAVTLHPPTSIRKSWYAYWNGLMASKSTGQRKLADAIVSAENMVKSGGKRADLSDTVLSDEEFDEIQRVHFGRKQDPAAIARAAKSLFSCLNSIDAFRIITGLKPITLATPDDCAAFQRKALSFPKNWRHRYPKGKNQVDCISPNTVLKWSRSLQAAFERANRNAPKRKCVRGVVDESKLLLRNPWNHFPWIEGTKRPIRQFDEAELLSLLKYLETKWSGMTAVLAVAKMFLWSSGRRSEIMGLTWHSLRIVGNEFHFEIVGKWGVEKWFRVPEGLYQDLLKIKTTSPFVFAAHNDQLRQHYTGNSQPGCAKNVGTEFDPNCLGDWFHQRIVDWSKSLPKGRASPHIFRKTSLQYARSGEDLNRQVAHDARVSESVLMTHYVKEADVQMRQRSNRTFFRIQASLSPELARQYGHVESNPGLLEEKLKVAIAAKDWPLVSQISVELANQQCPPTEKIGLREGFL